MKAINKIDAIVGRHIRERRAALKLSQPSLAEGLGISPQQLSKYEAGIDRVPASRLFTIATIMDVS